MQDLCVWGKFLQEIWWDFRNLIFTQKNFVSGKHCNYLTVKGEAAA
jgi:hypothetical protein